MLLRTLPILAALLLPSTVALAQERCEGTFCDLYYGNKPVAAKAPAQAVNDAKVPPGATPLTVPSGGVLGFLSGNKAQPAADGTSTPATQQSLPLVGVGGGGLAAMARGETSKRCEGTLCDLYYGSSDAEDDERPAARQTAVAANPDAVSRYRRTQNETPRCASKAGDPWKCYR